MQTVSPPRTNSAPGRTTVTDIREVEVARLLIGESPAMRELRQEILRFGPTRLPILVQGETGSGKELVARALHLVSRREGPLVAFNVCALSEGMFEDALFGHVKGAFTGANREAPGYLAEANGGSMFLDEISGLGMQAQAKLLRALETGQYRPVGGTRDRISDFRLISASNESLLAMNQQQRFRADLLHRIGGCVLEVPPLELRREDIPLLTRHFLTEMTGGRSTASDQAVARLQEHHWSGNVRELRHTVERLIVIAGDDEIGSRHVVAALRDRSATGPRDLEHAQLRVHLIRTLESNGWDVDLAARSHNVHRATIYRWMNKLGISMSGTAEGERPRLLLS